MKTRLAAHIISAAIAAVLSVQAVSAATQVQVIQVQEAKATIPIRIVNSIREILNTILVRWKMFSASTSIILIR